MEQLERKLRALLSTSSNTSSCSQTLSQISCASCKFHYAHTMQMSNRYGEMLQGLREALDLLQDIMTKTNYKNNSALLRNNQAESKHVENYTKARVTSFGISSASTPVSFKKDKAFIPVPVTASNKMSRYVHKTVVEATAKDKEFLPTRQSSRLFSRRYSKVSIIVGGIRTHDASEIEESGSSSAKNLFGTDNKNFEGRLAELMEYRHKNGHCSVPSSCHENPSLGAWCSLMRDAYRAIGIGSEQTHGLDQSRIEQLEKAGFKWLLERDGTNHATRFTTFDDRIKELLAFKMKYGHCQVAQTFTDYAPLYRYCCRLRLAYKSYHSGEGPTYGLNAARINQLQDMGFNWTSRKGNELRMDELIHFKKLNGHTRVPQDYPDNPALGMWCHDIRLRFNAMDRGKRRRLNRGNLKSQLDRIDFEWSMNEIDDVCPEVVDNDNSGQKNSKEEVICPKEITTKESLENEFDQKSSSNHDCNDIGRSEKEWVESKTATQVQKPNLLKKSSRQLDNEERPQGCQIVDNEKSEEKWVDLKTATPIQEPNLLKNSSHQLGNEERPQGCQIVDNEKSEKEWIDLKTATLIEEPHLLKNSSRQLDNEERPQGCQIVDVGISGEKWVDLKTATPIQEPNLLKNSSRQLGNEERPQSCQIVDVGKSEKEWIDLKTATPIEATPIEEPNLLKNSSHQLDNEERPQSCQSVDVKVAPVMPKRFQCGRVIIEFDSDDSDDSDLE